MGTALQPSNPIFEKRLRQKLDQTLDKKKLFSAIDKDPALVGAGIVYFDADGNRVKLRPFKPLCFTKPIIVVLKEPRSDIASPALEHAAEIRSNPRESRTIMEALNTGLSCSAAVLGWVVVFGSATAVPFSAGTSSALTFLSYSAAIASSAQCWNGAIRTVNEVYSPATNDWLDSQEWYRTTVFALDIISLGGAAGSGLTTVRSVKSLQRQGLSVKQALEGLTRAQRKRLTTEIIRSNHPTASNAMIKAMRRAGKYPKRLTSEQVQQKTIAQIKESIGATLSFTGSATSGSVRNLAIGIYEVTEK